MSENRAVGRSIGRLLRTGVAAAAALVIAGGLLYLWRHGGDRPSYHGFRGEPGDLRDPAAIVADACALHGRGLIQLGLLLLIATPVLRVAYAAWAFARQRDASYVLVTLTVLALLLFSLLFMR